MLLFKSDEACLKAKREYKKRRKGSYAFRMKALVWHHPTMAHPSITAPVLVEEDNSLDYITSVARERGIHPLYIIRIKRFK